MQKLLDEAEAAIANAASAAMEAERAAADSSIAREEAEQRRRCFRLIAVKLSLSSTAPLS